MKRILTLLLCLSFCVFADYSSDQINTSKEFMKLIKIEEIFDSVRDTAIKNALGKIDANSDVKNKLKVETDNAISFKELESNIAKCFLDNFSVDIMIKILDEHKAKNDNSFYLSDDWNKFMEPERQKKIFDAIDEVIKDILGKLNLADQIKPLLK